MEKDVYARLREFLDKMPGGYPATSSRVEIKLLKKLFTPEQAEITMQLKPFPEPLEVIAARLGMNEAEAKEKLEKMSNEGLIMGPKLGGKLHYLALSFVVGIYEFHMNSIDRELAELFEEYLPNLGLVWATTKTKQLRIVPVGSAVESVPSVAAYDRVREMVKKQTMASVAQCICRKERALLDHPCERKTSEICLQFGMAAQYSVEKGLSREISVSEALRLLDVAEDEALVLSPANTQDLLNICCCCGCCCGLLRGLKMMPNPGDFVQSAYQASIDPDLCSGCESCLDRCQVDAIKEDGDIMKVEKGRCIGCGLCVSACPEEAINFMERAKVEPPPANIVETMMKIAKERGLTFK